MNGMKRHRYLLLFLALVLIGCGYALFRAAHMANTYMQDRRVAVATWRAEYPYLDNPIAEETKQSLCQALSLPADDDMCQDGTEIMFYEVVQTVRQVFPVGETSYREVEEKLGAFPHVRSAPTREDGSLISLEYVYGLTEYEGACVYFWVDLEDTSTVISIIASAPEASTGSISTICEPFWGRRKDVSNP